MNHHEFDHVKAEVVAVRPDPMEAVPDIPPDGLQEVFGDSEQLPCTRPWRESEVN